MIAAVWINLILIILETFRMAKSLRVPPTIALVHHPVHLDNHRATITAARAMPSARIFRRRRYQRLVPVPKWMRARAAGIGYHRFHNVPMQMAATGVASKSSWTLADYEDARTQGCGRVGGVSRNGFGRHGLGEWVPCSDPDSAQDLLWVSELMTPIQDWRLSVPVSRDCTLECAVCIVRLCFRNWTRTFECIEIVAVSSPLKKLNASVRVGPVHLVC